MKRICLCLVIFVLALYIKPAFAVSYGDLYDIEWCPCNPENELSGQGSVVLGQTVMCPCDSMYDGYGRTLGKDTSKIKETVKKVKQKISNYKYYIGIEYNKTTTETSKDEILFDDIKFAVPVSTRANDVFDDQDTIGIVIGTRPHPNIGIEAFYNRTYKDNENIQYDRKSVAGGTDPSAVYHVMNSYTTKYQAFGVDIIGYLPVTNFMDFVAMVGLGKYYFDNEVTHEFAEVLGGSGSGVPYIDKLTSDFSEDTLAWRVGGGISFNIGRGVVIRGTYRYIAINSDTIKNLQEFSLGLMFVF